MKSISVFYLLCILLGSYSSADGQTVTKCFSAEWLQGERVVEYTLKGNKAAGTFIVRGNSIANTGIYNFSGTLAGSTLTVAFDGNNLPDVSPSVMKSLAWTLVKRDDKESLRIKLSGKNYQTNKYEESFAEFEPCDQSYAALSRRAVRVRFARGKNSASFPLVFKTKDERKTFLLNMRAGQQIEVDAIGCNISFYYPNKREGEEPAIDVFGSDPLTQSGDYLFVIYPAPSPGKYSVKFKVTN